MPRTRLLVSALILLGWSLCARSCCADTIAHEQKLWRLEGSFRDVTHPAATALVTKRSRVGLLLGNGNHCDYFVGELRRTALSKELIREAYAPQRSRGVEVASSMSCHRSNTSRMIFNPCKVGVSRLPLPRESATISRTSISEEKTLLGTTGVVIDEECKPSSSISFTRQLTKCTPLEPFLVTGAFISPSYPRRSPLPCRRGKFALRLRPQFVHAFWRITPLLPVNQLTDLTRGTHFVG